MAMEVVNKEPLEVRWVGLQVSHPLTAGQLPDTGDTAILDDHRQTSNAIIQKEFDENPGARRKVKEPDSKINDLLA